MRYLSVCSGIEAATCAWHSLGWDPFAFSEIEPFPSAVLAHHYPNVPNLGDMTKFKEWPDATIDVLVGGTPCQSFSVAGLRKGLDDPRGNLMLTYLAIADKYRPRWLVWENVPGVLSSGGGGADFGSLLGGLGQLGYGFAYRVLDAQYFGVAQRRRRVFVVGCLGDWRCAAAVLFERHSLQGHPAPSRQARKDVAGSIRASAAQRGGIQEQDGGSGLVACPHADISPAIKARDSKGASSDGDGDGDGDGAILVPMVAPCLTSNYGKQPDSSDTNAGPMLIPSVTHALRGEGFDASEDGTGRGTPLIPVPHVETMPTLRASAAQDGPGHGARSGDSKDEYIVPVVQPYTLAIRGRGDSHNLEYRSDGTANALLTPNGGRGGIGVGAVAFAQNQRDEVRLMDVAGALAAEPGAKQQTYAAIGWSEELTAHNDLAGTLQYGGQGGRHDGVMTPVMQVRRLIPRECERLQGFPDDYTLITVRGKPAADVPRYKALGNSMAVPVMHWIGTRIQMVEDMTDRRAA